jgi:uncharacterized membrane protein
MIEQIVSGGQTGADLGGLEAAHTMHIRTGGMAAKGYMTETGVYPPLEHVYGLMDVGMDYAARTEYNVSTSDGTLLVVGWRDSPGSRLTRKLIAQYGKTHWTIDFPGVGLSQEVATDIARWCKNKNIKVLNVAGNRESVAPGIQEYTQELVMMILSVREEDI